MRKLEMKVHNIIQLCLGDEILREVANKDTVVDLWFKLESLDVTKSLTNKLYMKHGLFTLRMEESWLVINLAYFIAFFPPSLQIKPCY